MPAAISDLIAAYRDREIQPGSRPAGTAPVAVIARLSPCSRASHRIADQPVPAAASPPGCRAARLPRRDLTDITVSGLSSRGGVGAGSAESA
ncbi:hypothetical protein FF36_02299 [Frankia torreyi]|uniref:Uncharacterized protein n=1 Tax=Frankia torreyi TaxID=1856 RepID=A0A0D8BGT1_9ACTN|nr:hypothetical protein FF36_02299 [Frankia torreyi]